MLNSLGHMDIISAFLTPDQAHQFHVASKHLFEWINAQSYFSKGLLGLSLFAGVGIFFVYLRLYLMYVPIPRSLEFAKIRLTERQRQRQALRLRNRQ